MQLLERLAQNNNPPNMYFVSDKNMDSKTLQPRIPTNFFTKNGFEDDITKRISFAPSIDKCLMGLSQNLEGKRLYVHIPIIENRTKIYKPTKSQVPDSKLTNEIWILTNVKIKCVGTIIVKSTPDNKPHKFSYGPDDKFTAELWDWSWSWENKFK